jgi:outer membrane protein TolC
VLAISASVVVLIAVLIPGTALAQTDAAASESTPVQVAVIADPGPAADTLATRIRSETEALFAPRRPVQASVVQGTDPWTPADAKKAYQSAQSTDPDAIVVVGPISLSSLCVGPDPTGAAPLIGMTTGSGLLVPDSTADQCTLVGPTGWPLHSTHAFRNLTPLSSVTVAIDARVVKHVPEAAERIQRRGEDAGLQTRLVPISPDPSDLPPLASSDAVVLDHVDRMSGRSLEPIIGSLTDRGLPVFAHDPAVVERHGALAAPDRPARQRARHAALAIERVVTNAPPPAQTHDADSASVDPPLVVNETTAETLGLALPWDVQVSARLVGTSSSNGEAFTLETAMRKSITANLQLQAKRQEVAAQSNRIDVARARMLPQVQVSATGQAVSEDLASASFGAQPERQLSSAVSVRQVLFSEPAFAQFSVERRMQAVREFRRQSTRLDAAKNAADAYLAVLEARAGVSIQRENVRTVRTNLRAAQTRRQAGAADPREVSRLETELARAEQGLLRALGRKHAAEIQYNRVLNRPLDADVELAQPATAKASEILDQFPYTDRLEQSGKAPAFREFWIAEAEERAPEVEAVDRLVSARKRQLTSTTRSFWLPQISLEGRLSQRLHEDGVGTSSPSLPLSNSPGGQFSLPTPPDQQWSVGITASLPLFQGTERAARRRQAKKQLQASRTEQAMAELGVEQKVRTALVQLETAYASAERAIRAAKSAQQTLDVTQAAYREGTASLVDLIDAQNAALATREKAATTAYDVLRQWMAVQRAGGSFRPLRTPQEQAAFEQRLDTVLSDRPDPR